MGSQLEARLGEVGLLFRQTALLEGRQILGSVQKLGIEEGVSSSPGPSPWGSENIFWFRTEMKARSFGDSNFILRARHPRDE